jgi:hypothetical protein
MTTRDTTRRELRDLARMAATMPREVSPPPAPAKNASPPRPPAPSSASRITVPPASASIPPASRTVEPPSRRPRGGRSTLLWSSLGAGLAIAMVGGVTLGRTLAHHQTTAGASVPALPPAVVDATPSPVVPATATAAPAAVLPAVTAPQPAARDAPVSASLPTAVTPKPAIAPRRPVWRAPPKGAPPAATPAGHDSLDEAIRRAVASP